MDFGSGKIVTLTAGMSLFFFGIAGILVIMGYIIPTWGLCLVLGGIGSWLLVASMIAKRSERGAFQASAMYYAIWGIVFLSAAFIVLNIGAPILAVASVFTVLMVIGMIVIARELFKK